MLFETSGIGVSAAEDEGALVLEKNFVPGWKRLIFELGEDESWARFATWSSLLGTGVP
jgi:hypothetical protein